MDPIILISLFVFGIVAFIISTISGGGGSLLLIPGLNWLIGTTHTAPVLNLGAFIGRPSRIIIFWKHIRWDITIKYVPSAVIGSVVGAYLFHEIRIEWLQIFIGLFLISTIFQYRFGKLKKSFTTKHWHFIPLGFIVTSLSTIVGAVGPVLNPFLLNAGLEKEELVATKAANSFFTGVAQISSYSFFGLLIGEYWLYGLSLGFGATIGNIIGKRFLGRMKSITFRRYLIALMVISGIIMILRQIDL